MTSSPCLQTEFDRSTLEEPSLFQITILSDGVPSFVIVKCLLAFRSPRPKFVFMKFFSLVS